MQTETHDTLAREPGRNAMRDRPLEAAARSREINERRAKVENAEMLRRLRAM